MTPPIGHLELLTIVVSIKLWKEKLKGKIITLYSDSETAVKAVANKRSSVLFMQACLRELFIVLAYPDSETCARKKEHLSRLSKSLASEGSLQTAIFGFDV